MIKSSSNLSSLFEEYMCFVLTLKDNGIQCSANFDRHFLFCLKRCPEISQIHSFINLYIVYGSWVDYIRKEWTKWVNGSGRWRRLYTAREKNKKQHLGHICTFILATCTLLKKHNISSINSQNDVILQLYIPPHQLYGFININFCDAFMFIIIKYY